MTAPDAEHDVDEVQRLRRCLRDVIALSALPAVWSGFEPEGVTESVADVLIRSMELEFVYICVPVPLMEAPHRTLRGRHGPEGMAGLQESVERWLQDEQTPRPGSLPGPHGDGEIQVTAVPLGHGAAEGTLVAGSRHGDFPTTQDRLLLGVAANQAAVVFQRLSVEQELRRSRQQLETERAHLQQVFTRAPAFIATLSGADHCFEMANPAYLQLVGQRTVVGMTVREALPELRGQGFFELLDQVYRSGEPFVADEMRALLARGAGGETEEVFVSFVYQPLREADGSISGIFVHGVEVTEQVHARQRIEELAQVNRTITDNATAALFLLDARGYCTFMNPAAEAMTGWKLDEIRLLPFHDALHHMHPDGRPYPRSECPVDRTLPQMQKVRAHEDLFIRRDGTFFPVLVAVEPIIRDGGAAGAVLEVRDITAEHAARAELQRQAAELAERDRQKDEFLAMLAHELRNPLAPVLNATQVLQARATQDPLLLRQTSVIDRQARHMARLLDDLLDVARITRGKIELRRQDMDLRAAVEQAAEGVRQLMEQRRHDLNVCVPSEPLQVRADPTRLHQVIGNLLNNAAKYTDPGGQVTLQVSAEGTNAVIRVRDNGSGIPKELQARVFDLFTQGDRSLGRGESGLGIGLTMVKRLVELHGGSVSVFSEGLGRGSTFTVRWPLAQERAAAALPSADPATDTAPRRILIVDDNRDAAETLGELATLWGHRVRLVHDGAAALEAVAAELPEVVLLDIGMPGMDGYEVARQLRAAHGRTQIRLIALTGYGQEEDRQRALSTGFDAHLTKPVDPDSLRRLLADEVA